MDAREHITGLNVDKFLDASYAPNPFNTSSP